MVRCDFELPGIGWNSFCCGMENHIVLADLRPKGVDGSRVERAVEPTHIADR